MVLEGGQGNYDFDGNEGGGIDFDDDAGSDREEGRVDCGGDSD